MNLIIGVCLVVAAISLAVLVLGMAIDIALGITFERIMSSSVVIGGVSIFITLITIAYKFLIEEVLVWF